MNTKHIPAPWTAGQVKENPVFDIIGPDITGRGREIIGQFYATQSRAVNAANVAVISAAPESLAALRELVDAVENHRSGAVTIASLNRLCDAEDAARAILAKVEGAKV